MAKAPRPSFSNEPLHGTWEFDYASCTALKGYVPATIALVTVLQRLPDSQRTKDEVIAAMRQAAFSHVVEITGAGIFPAHTSDDLRSRVQSVTRRLRGSDCGRWTALIHESYDEKRLIRIETTGLFGFMREQDAIVFKLMFP
jgi:hypothetical protein